MNKLQKVVQNFYENIDRAQSKCKKGRDLADDYDFDEEERQLRNCIRQLRKGNNPRLT